MSQPSLASPTPVRAIGADDLGAPRPIYVVWELTMKCDQPCQHCGSRAGQAREDELGTEEILEVARGLVRLGTREVTVIGGEAYLRTDLVQIVRALASSGIRVTMQTGGRAFTLERARSLRDAGLDGLGVSVDGPARIHDRLRGNLGSHQAAVQALPARWGAPRITRSGSWSPGASSRSSTRSRRSSARPSRPTRAASRSTSTATTTSATTARTSRSCGRAPETWRRTGAAAPPAATSWASSRTAP
jgi:hypothetical protein